MSGPLVKPTIATNRSFVAAFIKTSTKPGSSVSIAFSAGVINVTLDHQGDWTITVGLQTRSGTMLSTETPLHRLGFFKAAENEGTAYFLWTSALVSRDDNRCTVEDVLFETLKTIQNPTPPHYIS